MANFESLELSESSAIPAQDFLEDIILNDPTTALETIGVNFSAASKPKIAYVRNVQPLNVNGGPVANGLQDQWNTRTLNTLIDTDNIGISLLNDVITLPAGFYRIQTFAATRANYRIYNRLISTSGPTFAIYGPENVNTFSGNVLVSTGTMNLELQYYSEISRTNVFSLGRGIESGENILSEVEIMRWDIA